MPDLSAPFRTSANRQTATITLSSSDKVEYREVRDIPPGMSVSRIALPFEVIAALRAARFTFGGREERLQEAIAEVLEPFGVEREVRLGVRDRIDHLVPAARVGVEAKVAGPADRVLGQLERYARSDRLDVLVLVTTRSAHVSLPALVGGKPLTVLYLGPQAL